MNIVDRVKAPTPKFFRVLRAIGLSLVAASGAIIAAPIAVPAVLVTVAGYLTVAGTVLTAVSQTAVEKEEGAPAPDDDPEEDVE
ncbi:hypothetical protein KK062_06900 [Fulvivirgaceae bacterium PWU5]|uniref:Uncharacterized protein n=1 Tax=Dawidia cretensis TaxID=2782350 RepID=A0AAP2DV30_9BACT|nr:hypothetical protein [Dawidia cretensis]MBT1707941.1 hypothetical protein [Dawidia cretensis]